MILKSLANEQIKNQTVLLRTDYNVGSDDSRIQASLPTIKLLLENHNRIVIISHLGRPTSQKEAEFSLRPVTGRLAKLLPQTQVKFVPDCQGPLVDQALKELKMGEVLVLENLRFYEEEEANETQFAQNLAKFAQVYVNDAFSVSHRPHASVSAVTKYLPSFAGLNLISEVENLTQVLDRPKRPLVVVIGGAKISDKAEAVANLAKLADMVLIGGAVANLFLKAEGFQVFKSYVQDASSDLKKKGIDYLHVAENLLHQNEHQNFLLDGFIPLPKILYPIDMLAAELSSADNTQTQIIDLTAQHRSPPTAEQTPTTKNSSLSYLDIGPKTIKLYGEIIKDAQTIFWNGPMGVFEKPQFAQGTKAIAQAIAQSPATSILGGGDTLAAAAQFKLTDKFSFVSTAGGASLDFLAGKKLPGLIPLTIDF